MSFHLGVCVIDDIRVSGSRLGLLVYALIASAPTSAAPPVLSELGRAAPGYTYPAFQGYAVLDVDGDGLDDFIYGVAAGSRSSHLMVAGIKSDGSFGIKQSLPLPDRSALLTPPTDFPLDDIYVLDTRSGRVSVFGDWPLTEARNFDSAPSVSRAAILDTDGDGQAELLIATLDANGVRSYDADTGALRWQTQVWGGQVRSFASVTQVDGRGAIALGLEGSDEPMWLDASSGELLPPLQLLSAPFLATARFDDSRAPALVAGGGFAPVRVLQSRPPWTLQWSYQPSVRTGSLLVTPLIASSGPAIVTGDANPPSALRIIDPATQTESWNFATPDTLIYSIGAGDADGDGVADIVFAVNASQDAWVASRLRWIDAKSHIEKWRLESQVGRFDVVALGDLDGDGRLEQVVAGEFNPIGKTYIVDADTDESTWESADSASPPGLSMTTTAVAIGEIRAGLPDIVLGGDADMTGRLIVLDGRTREVRSSIVGTSGHPMEGRRIESLLVYDYDGDGIGDIVAATSYRFDGIRDPRVLIFSGIDGSLLAQSDSINSIPYRARSLFLGDTDSDGVDELILIAENRIQVFDAKTLAARSTFIVDSIGGRWIAGAATGAQILVFRPDGVIEFRDARTLALQRSIVVPAPLAAVDVLDPAGARLAVLADSRLHVVGGSSGEVFASSTVLGEVTGSFSTPLATYALAEHSWQIAGGTDAGYFRFRVDLSDSIFENGFETR